MKNNPFSLDNQPGPAQPIDAVQTRAMASRIVSQSVTPTMGWKPWAIGVGALAIAAAIYLGTKPGPIETPRVVPPTVSVVIEPPPPASTMTASIPVENLPPTVAPPAIAPKEPNAEDLLRTANRLRSEGKWTEARDTYERAARPRGSDTAYAALVASAELRLEHLADFKGALDRFLEGLRLQPDGPLAENCRLGVADSYRAIGDAEKERAALEQYLSKHPSGLAASRAKTRLSELH